MTSQSWLQCLQPLCCTDPNQTSPNEQVMGQWIFLHSAGKLLCSRICDVVKNWFKWLKMKNSLIHNVHEFNKEVGVLTPDGGRLKMLNSLSISLSYMPCQIRVRLVKWHFYCGVMEQLNKFSEVCMNTFDEISKSWRNYSVVFFYQL